MTDQLKLAFHKVENALERLKEATLKPADQEELFIDATIQRFEFSFELFWKLLKRILEEKKGITALYPRDVLEEAYQGEMINDEKAWLRMLKDRNMTSHTYNQNLALEIYNNIKKYLPLMESSFESLKTLYKN